ncbi:hypothetical protein COC69_05690 [Bacillus cereus]|uniref:Uncharacterized protein n=1 Tax=Bacillus cereus TaxID=1396 RepID=A0A9X7CR26_BACCE|nr:hypothetical protein [Bacillus cereus]PGS81622.1 hypothetical protein COC69_05690 [Bacillus cereus]
MGVAEVEKFLGHFGQIFTDLIVNLPTIVLLASVGGKIGKRWFATLTENVNEQMQEMQESVKSLEREVLRLQLLDGMHQKRFSESEVSFFYDKYKAVGGNTFVSDKVEEYIKELHGGAK